MCVHACVRVCVRVKLFDSAFQNLNAAPGRSLSMQYSINMGLLQVNNAFITVYLKMTTYVFGLYKLCLSLHSILYIDYIELILTKYIGQWRRMMRWC